VTERRSDEAALYYIVKRDLDRGALFPGNNGWIRQLTTRGGRVDYAIGYGDKIICVEVKAYAPDKSDFRQVDTQYRRFFDAIFLAYPADAAGEALFLSREKEWYQGIGLISLTPYRSHVIRPGRLGRRVSEHVYRNWFDDAHWFASLDSVHMDQYDRLAATALESGAIYSSFDRKSAFSDSEVSSISLRESDWRALALLYSAAEAIGYLKYFQEDWLVEISREKLGWPRPDFTKLSFANLVDYYTYGPEMLRMFALSNSCCSQLSRARKGMKANLGSSTWQRLNRLSEQISYENRQIQRKTLPALLN
jgi:hypothetical protein